MPWPESSVSPGQHLHTLHAVPPIAVIVPSTRRGRPGLPGWSRGVAKWYLIGYHRAMDAAVTIRQVRSRAGLSLRTLAAPGRHVALDGVGVRGAAARCPTVETLDRIVRAAGYELAVDLVPNVGGRDRDARGRELVEVLELAAQFPARHASRR